MRGAGGAGGAGAVEGLGVEVFTGPGITTRYGFVKRGFFGG